MASIGGTLGTQWIFPWANRCTNCAPLEHDNLPWETINGVSKGYKFSSYRTADACTVAQLYALVGDLTAAQNTLPGSPGGVSAILPGQDPKAFLDANGNLMDVCSLRQGPMPESIQGVILDYEVCDQRSPNQALALSGAYGSAARAYGLVAMYYTNRLTAPCGGPFNGITPDNGSDILRAYGYGTIMTDFTISDALAAADLQQQLDMVASNADDRSHVIVQVQIGSDMSCRRFQIVHDFVVKNGLYGIEAWPAGADVTNPASVYYARIRYITNPAAWPCL
jgi:hypothetical protein